VTRTGLHNGRAQRRCRTTQVSASVECAGEADAVKCCHQIVLSCCRGNRGVQSTATQSGPLQFLLFTRIDKKLFHNRAEDKDLLPTTMREPGGPEIKIYPVRTKARNSADFTKKKAQGARGNLSSRERGLETGRWWPTRETSLGEKG